MIEFVEPDRLSANLLRELDRTPDVRFATYIAVSCFAASAWATRRPISPLPTTRMCRPSSVPSSVSARSTAADPTERRRLIWVCRRTPMPTWTALLMQSSRKLPAVPADSASASAFLSCR